MTYPTSGVASTRGMTIAGPSVLWTMNVISFSTTLFGQISGTQVQSEAIWFPIKLLQPDIQFDVVFANETDFQDFQNFVRTHQKQASNSSQLLTFNWPVRNIVNWTGFITKIDAGGMRWNVMPRTSFIVSLADSLVTQRTYQGSISSNFNAIYDLGIPGSVLSPSALEQQFLSAMTQGATPAPAVAPAPNASTPAPTGQQPQIPTGLTAAGQSPPRILPGS
jgi:hypothetical protein